MEYLSSICRTYFNVYLILEKYFHFNLFKHYYFSSTNFLNEEYINIIQHFFFFFLTQGKQFRCQQIITIHQHQFNFSISSSFLTYTIGKIFVTANILNASGWIIFIQLILIKDLFQNFFKKFYFYSFDKRKKKEAVKLHFLFSI